MEHYTASDDRPLDKCLADVAGCDIYVGLFAFRYGFVPNQDNPKNLSITELEYQQARKDNKPCLIFMADENDWSMKNCDCYTGEGEQGLKIKDLRDRLSHDHTRSLFRLPDDLATSVSTAVSNLLEENRPQGTDAPASKAAVIEPLPREITSDLLVAYSDIDAVFATDLRDYLSSRNLRTIFDQRALFASTADDILRLERSIRSCHAAVVLASDTSVRQLEERRNTAATVCGIMQARTENLFAICLSDDSTKRMTGWPLGAIEGVTGWKPRESAPARSLSDRLKSLRLTTGLDSGKQWVGLPVIVVAMTRQEADEADAKPEMIRDRLGNAAYKHFMDLRASVVAGRLAIADRYGARRLDCRPFANLATNIETLLKSIVDQLNDDPPSMLRGRFIKIQNYDFDELLSHSDQTGAIFAQLLSTGCVVIFDEYSVFHPKIQEVLVSSGLLANEQVSLVTLSPTNPYLAPPFDTLEEELRNRMGAAFNRFATVFDPQCELSVGDEKRLKRWLNASLPYTIQSLRNPRPNRDNIVQFAREQGIDPQPKIAPLLYAKGGPL